MSTPEDQVAGPQVPAVTVGPTEAAAGASDLQGLSDDELMTLYQQSLQGGTDGPDAVVAGPPAVAASPVDAGAGLESPPPGIGNQPPNRIAPAQASAPAPAIDPATAGMRAANSAINDARDQADKRAQLLAALRAYPVGAMSPAERGAQMVTAEMPWYDRFAVGMGRAPVAAGQSLKQLALHGGAALGLVDPADVRSYDQQVADEAALYEAGVGNTLVGKAGSLTGNAMLAYSPGGIARGIGLAGQAVTRSLPGLMGRAAAVGAAESAMTNPATDPDGSFVGQKLEQAGLGAMTGGALSGLGHGVGRVVEETRSRNLPFRIAAGRVSNDAPLSPADTAFARESDALSQRTGVPFTPGQATGSRGLTGLEQAVRQSSRTADRVFDVDSKAAGALDSYVNRIMDGISSTDRSAGETGDMVRDALKGRIAKLTQQRARVAKDQYGRINQLVGGRPLIEPDNLRAALSDVAAEYGSIEAPGAKALSTFATNTSTSELGDVSNLMKLRSYLSKVAGGQARISGEPVDRKVAATMLGAIDNDLDSSANRLGGNVGEMLRAANQNYRNFSEAINYVKASPLGKMLGKDVADRIVGGEFNTVAPEKVIDKLRTMKPSEVSVTRNLLQDESPDTWAAVRRQLISDAMDKARSTASTAGAKTLPMQPASFVRALGGNTSAGRAWLNQVFPKGELGQLTDAFNAALRLGDKFGYNGSGTAAQMESLDMLNVPTSATGVATKLAKGAAARMFGNRLAAAMATPDGRSALLQLDKLPPSAARSNELISKIAAITAGTVDQSERTADYQNRLRSAKNEWDDTLREARGMIGPDTNVPDDVIQSVTQQISARYGVSPASILKTHDTP